MISENNKMVYRIVWTIWLILITFYFTVTTSGLVSAGSTAAKPYLELDPSDFKNSTDITNEWMPLKPGTRFVYEGTTVDDGEVLPHQVVITVTDLTKVINGVRSVVTWDLDYSDGELVEAEIAFFAQDKEGNVWRMGEYPEEYEDGEIVEAPAWIHGVEGAKAGISMMAKPQIGTPSYSQGWGPAVNFTDRGEVYKMGQKTSVPFGSYQDVLVIKESSEDEPNAFQLKYFARKVGNVRVGWMGEGEKLQEVLELVKVEHLSPKQMVEVRKKALKLEKSAYENSLNVYAQTKPLAHPLLKSTSLMIIESKPKEPSTKSAIQSKITEDEAVKIAQEAVPGDVTAVSIEKKLGANRYVVELLAKDDGIETDVIIDMESGKVLGTEK